MDALARAHRTPLRPGRVPRRSGRRAGGRADGLGARRGGGDGRRPDAGPASGSGCSRVRLFRPFPSAAARGRPAADACAPSPCSTAPRSPAPSASRSTSTCVAALDEAHGQRRAAVRPAPPVIGGRYGLSSKEFTPAMVKAVFDELAGRQAQAPLHGRHQRRRDHLSLPSDPSFTRASRRPARCRPCSSGWARTARWAPTRTSVKIIGEGTDLLRPGLLRLRLEEVGLDDRVAPALRARSRSARPTSISERRLRGLPPVRAARPRRRAGAARPGRHVPAEQPYGADEVWDRLPRERTARSCVDKHIELLGHRRGRAWRPQVGLGNRINTVMQPCFFALAGVLPADEAIARIKDAVEKAYGQPRPGGRRAQLRRHRPLAGQLAGSHVPASAPSARGRPMAARPCRRSRRDFVRRRHRGRSWPARATCCRSARCRSTARSRPARTSTRSGPSPSRSRSGIPTSASTAASAPSSARTPRSA